MTRPAAAEVTTAAFRELWEPLADIGRHPDTGGYHRLAWTEPELACRAWFVGQAHDRGLPVTDDGNGNLFAWWGDPLLGDAVLTGSHFDSVPGGGAYDGTLGIVGALLAIDALRAAGVAPRRPIAVAAFAEEEGARFGVPCLGSKLFTGGVDPADAAVLTDADGVTLVEAVGDLPAGARPDLLRRLRCFVELHVEQGRALDQLAVPVATASGIWPHCRWLLDFTGAGDHAGSTRMADRRDPMLTFAYTVLAANKEARLRGAHATIGRAEIEPNASNAVPSRVRAWLDARAPAAQTLDELVAAVTGRATDRAGRDGTTVGVEQRSYSPPVTFDAELAERVRRTAADAVGVDDCPLLATAAGHDAGVLAGHLPTAMIFVRNPTGVSHAPGESATDDDCVAGIRALAAVLEELACH